MRVFNHNAAYVSIRINIDMGGDYRPDFTRAQTELVLANVRG